jgi:molecular chaperone DnaK
MIHLGIDLGTTFSLISHLNANGQPTLFPDSHNASEFRTPSVLSFTPGGVLVGRAVEELSMSAGAAGVHRPFRR